MHPPEQPELLIPQALLLRAADDLATRFVGVFGKETVERCVFDSYTALRRTAKITTHLPTLSIHFARERLTAMAQAEGAIVKDVPEVLFVCTHNAGRSVLASSLLSHHAGSSVHVRSAGTSPAATVDPNVIQHWLRSASTPSTSSRSRCPTTSSRPRTLSSPLAAATPAPCTRARGTWTGTSKTPRASRCRACAPSATTSTRTFER